MKTVSTVLLIDDCEATNFLHKMVLENSGRVGSVEVKYNGREALDYLTAACEGHYPQPDIIFLDINMPVMNGWEFLDEYQKLQDDQKAGVVVVMLTTSFNPADEQHAREMGLIDNFQHKPLTEEKLGRILDDCLPSDGEG